MNILVLSGSPKGELSVTLQYAAYLKKRFPAHTFEIVHVGQRIKRLERDEATRAEILADVRAADLVLWTTPVYYMLVPGQLKRFIELVAERGAVEAFAGRAAAAITTSIHLPFVRRQFLARIKESMVMPFRRMLDQP